MSGPNSDYDPVEVTPLRADEVEAMRDAALAAIAAAADLEQLKEVRIAHAGDRSPLALASWSTYSRADATSVPRLPNKSLYHPRKGFFISLSFLG